MTTALFIHRSNSYNIINLACFFLYARAFSFFFYAKNPESVRARAVGRKQRSGSGRGGEVVDGRGSSIRDHGTRTIGTRES